MDIHTHQFAPTEKTLRSCQYSGIPNTLPSGHLEKYQETDFLEKTLRSCQYSGIPNRKPSGHLEKYQETDFLGRDAIKCDRGL